MAWDLTKNKIIKRALRIIGVIAQGDEPYPEQLSEGSDVLNAYIKSFNLGNKLWKVNWYTVKLETTTTNIVGSDGVIYDCIRGHVSETNNRPASGAHYQSFWKSTTTSFTAWATGTDYVIGDQIYVDNTGYKVYTCTADHTASALFTTDAANWDEETDYNTWVTETSYYNIGDLVLPTNVLQVLKVWYKDISSTDRTDTPMELISGEDFLNIWDKEDTDTYPDVAYVDKSDSKQRLFIRKIPNNSTSFELYVRVEEVVDDLIEPGDNPDYSMQFYEMLVYGLAVKLCPEYGISPGERNSIKAEYVELVNLYKQRNTEDVDEERIESSF